MCHTHPPATTYPHFCERTHMCRAADPSINLSAAKSDFKGSNIFSVMYKTNYVPPFQAKCTQTVQRARHQRDVVHHKKICEKHRCLNYVQKLWRWHLTTRKMENLQHTSYQFSFVDAMLWVDMSFNIVHSAMATEKLVSPGSDTYQWELNQMLQWLQLVSDTQDQKYLKFFFWGGV